MSYAYDTDNIFAKILRGEIPNTTVVETEHTLAFEDIRPQAPVHVLVIPKGRYVNYDHFASDASDAEIADFTRAIGEVIRLTDVAPVGEAKGYRLLSNAGTDAIQEVPHMHVHVVGGRALGRILPAG